MRGILKYNFSLSDFNMKSLLVLRLFLKASLIFKISTWKFINVEQILNARYIKALIKFVLYKEGANELKFMVRPVKVDFLYMDVSNLLLFLVILISRKFKELCCSTSLVNLMFLC